MAIRLPTSMPMIFLSLFASIVAGCLGHGDDPGAVADAGDAPQDNGGGDGDSDSDADGDGDTDSSSETDTSLDSGFVLDGGYSDWEEGGDDFAPGDIESFVEDESHHGWKQARCFECHGVGQAFEPADHDPRMQYWSWSCARGFPGAQCHGHGVNGARMFNHDGDPAFAGCTQDMCHCVYNSDPRYENHGFTQAPDLFCNACHDYYWEDWPDAGLRGG